MPVRTEATGDDETTGYQYGSSGTLEEPPAWLRSINPDPCAHHFVEIVQQPAADHGQGFVHLEAVCTCSWRSGRRLVYLHASTSWAHQRARRQLEDAGIAHIRSLLPPAS